MSTVSAQNTAHASHDHGHDHAPEIPYETKIRSNRLGLWLFCFSELFLFAALLSSRFYLWRDPTSGEILRPELSQIVGFITTGILLVSSYFMVRAEVAVAKGHRSTFYSSLAITFALGLLFLLGVVIIEWGTIPALAQAITGHAPLRTTDGVFGAVFFAMTGMHALHVITGLIFILIVISNGRKGKYTTERHWEVEACAIYWHYVDVIWIFFYPALYLIGKVIEHHG